MVIYFKINFFKIIALGALVLAIKLRDTDIKIKKVATTYWQLIKKMENSQSYIEDSFI